MGCYGVLDTSTANQEILRNPKQTQAAQGIQPKSPVDISADISLGTLRNNNRIFRRNFRREK